MHPRRIALGVARLEALIREDMRRSGWAICPDSRIEWDTINGVLAASFAVIPSEEASHPAGWVDCARCRGEGDLLLAHEATDPQNPEIAGIQPDGDSACPDCCGKGGFGSWMPDSMVRVTGREFCVGCYLNVLGPKEAWLRDNAVPISREEAAKHADFDDVLLVCLVDNGPFTAAGIAYREAERDEFVGVNRPAGLPPDTRRRTFYLVERSKLPDHVRTELDRYQRRG